MAKPGPKPKPNKAKKLAGNPGKRPLDHSEPQIPIGVPKPPYGISKPARELWKQLAPLLEDAGIMTEVDRAAFEMMCLHYGFAIEACKEIKIEGFTTIGSRNNLVRHPILSILSEQSRLFLRFAIEFGLTPSSRDRLSIPETDNEISLAEELFRAVEGGDKE